MVTVSATEDSATSTFTIPKLFQVVDDNVNEIEQSFVLVAQLGPDVPEEFACFQTQVGVTECLGRKGATEIKIVDNDRTLATTTENAHLLDILSPSLSHSPLLSPSPPPSLTPLSSPLLPLPLSLPSPLPFSPSSPSPLSNPPSLPLLAMIIGFSERCVTISESNAAQGDDEFPLIINVHSNTTSEQEYRVLFRWQQTSSTATVEPINQPLTLNFDARFGSRVMPTSPIEDERILQAGDFQLRSELITFIRNDFRSEDEECYTLRILSPDVIGIRDIFDCFNDDTNATDFFCHHTICILDDDGI